MASLLDGHDLEESIQKIYQYFKIHSTYVESNMFIYSTVDHFINAYKMQKKPCGQCYS